MHVLIMAQGRQRRLAGTITQPKQTLPLLGEPLIARTIRLLRGHVGRIYVIGWPEIGEAAREADGLIVLNDPGLCILDGIAHDTARGFWGDAANWPTLILLGDVVFSQPALYAILDRGHNGELFFALTPDLSRGSGEVFAMGFGADHAVEVETLLAAAPCRAIHEAMKDDPQAIYQPGHLRNLIWQVMETRGLERDSFPAEYHSSIALPIDDWTNDIDTPNDVALLWELEDRILRERRCRQANTPEVE